MRSAFPREGTTGLAADGSNDGPWLLRTATSTDAVALAPDGSGPVLQDWTDGRPRAWAPAAAPGLRLPIDRWPLGVGSDLRRWDGPQRERAAELIVLYREIRATVHRGRVEQHGAPQDPLYALEYGTPTQTVVLVYGRGPRPTGTVRPRTLAASRRYRLSGSGAVRTGATWAADADVAFALASGPDVLVFDAVDPGESGA